MSIRFHRNTTASRKTLILGFLAAIPSLDLGLSLYWTFSNSLPARWLNEAQAHVLAGVYYRKLTFLVLAIALGFAFLAVLSVLLPLVKRFAPRSPPSR